MKELYTSPELELLCLTAEENLANNGVDFDDLLDTDLDSGKGDSVQTSAGDIDIPL